MSAITEIKGVGPVLAAACAEKGFKSVRNVATATPEALSEVRGVSEARGRILIDIAQAILGIDSATGAQPVSTAPAKAAKRSEAKKPTKQKNKKDKKKKEKKKEKKEKKEKKQKKAKKEKNSKDKKKNKKKGKQKNKKKK